MLQNPPRRPIVGVDDKLWSPPPPSGKDDMMVGTLGSNIERSGASTGGGRNESPGKPECLTLDSPLRSTAEGPNSSVDDPASLFRIYLLCNRVGITMGLISKVTNGRRTSRRVSVQRCASNGATGEVNSRTRYGRGALQWPIMGGCLGERLEAY